MTEWLRPHESGALLLLYIQPGASLSGISGIHSNRLKVKIKAPPRDGEANEALIKFISEFLQIPKKRIHLLKGESSRQKDLLVELSMEEALSAFKGRI